MPAEKVNLPWSEQEECRRYPQFVVPGESLSGEGPLSEAEESAELLGEHRFLDHRSSKGDMCYCGWSSQLQPHSFHQLDEFLKKYQVRTKVTE